MASYLSDSERERFKELLTVSNLRGFQGAGVIVSDNKCNTEVFKTTDTGTHLAHDRDFNHRLYHKKPFASTSLLVGHTRWPTKGAISLDTTHPHTSGHIVGVHNGTIDHINGKYVHKDDSDSALLFKSFAENGVADTIKETEGAWCLIWVNEQEQTINFLRNDKRPLYLAKMAGGSTMYWASERGMLDFVLGRQGPKFEILTLLPNKWSTYQFGLQHKLDDSCVDVVELKGKAPPAVGAFVPFLGRTNWIRDGIGKTEAIAEATQGASKSGSTGSGNVTPSGTPKGVTPSLGTTTPIQLSDLTQKLKPRMRWSHKESKWVEITPPSLIQKTPTVISLGGTQQTSKNVVEKQATSNSKEVVPLEGETFHSPHSDDDDGQFLQDSELVGERDFTQPIKDIKSFLKEMFDGQQTGDHYDGYRQTIHNNWVASEQYVDLLKKGCMWCGDPKPDIKSNLWVETDEFVCEECSTEQYCIDYICQALKVTREEFDTSPQRKTA